MHVRLAPVVAAVIVLSLALAACATKEGEMAMQHVDVKDGAVAVKKPEIPSVEKPNLALEKTTPSAGYKSDKCLVTDEPLGATKVAYSYGGQEVQFCCPACAVKFMQSPDTYLAKLAK